MALFSTKKDWSIGDTAWIHGYGDQHENPRTAGRIVHIFTLCDWVEDMKHYVIEIPTAMDPLLAVRQATSMWPYPETPL